MRDFSDIENLIPIRMQLIKLLDLLEKTSNRQLKILFSAMSCTHAHHIVCNMKMNGECAAHMRISKECKICIWLLRLVL